MLHARAIGLVSLRLTRAVDHEANLFSWAPFAEVAKLFAAIFVTMAPMSASCTRARRGRSAAC